MIIDIPAINLNYFIITGGPGAGKTVLLQELNQRGFFCVEEVARNLIKQEVSAGGRALPWIDKELYLKIMFDGSVDGYQKAAGKSTGIVFFDRGIADSITYAEIIGSNPTEAMNFYAMNFRYNPIVFFLPPWAEIYEADEERKQIWEEAVSIAALNAAVYKRYHYQLIEVPKNTPDGRADFVTDYIIRSGFPV